MHKLLCSFFLGTVYISETHVDFVVCFSWSNDDTNYGLGEQASS